MRSRDRLVLTLVALAIALAGARDHTGGWNDASHLAAAESLVDRGTFVIDQSAFIDRTLDRVYIRGHYYSDKPPVASLLLAGIYSGLQHVVGVRASDDPPRFVRWMTIGSSGIAYVIAIWAVYGIGLRLGLSRPLRALLAGSLALSTVALPYSRAVNQHELFLAVSALLFLVVSRADTHAALPRGTWWRAGALAGLGYALDLAAGPLLLIGVLWLAWFRERRAKTVAIVLAAAMPVVLLHHGITWAIGGTLRPLNAVPEYLLGWPGSPFDAGNMTGLFSHSFWSFIAYAPDILVGNRGFLFHNLPILLIVPGLVVLWRHERTARPELLMAIGWCVATWLAYSVLSRNFAGGAVSIRWFVPLLAPAYFTLALLLRREPARAAELVLLSVVGAAIAGIAWWRGPWTLRMVPYYWPIVAAGLASWVAVRWHRSRPTTP
jgi:hypothetical protein